ncbi:four helix bundle protein [Patescibacteria group bacterium]
MSNVKFASQKSNLKSSDIKVRAYNFSLEIIKFTNKFPNNRTFWVIGDQLLRSATSIGANITEGKSASSKRDFIKFYEISLKSANETKYWLCLLRDTNLSEEKEKLLELINEIVEICNMLGASLLTLKNKR